MRTLCTNSQTHCVPQDLRLSSALRHWVPRALVLLLASGLLLGCAKANHPASEEAYRAKMRLVVAEAIRQTQDPVEKKEFKSGKVFVNIEDLEMPVVGVSVPVGKSAILVTFMTDYFESHDIQTLAKDALQDFRRVVASKKDQH